MEATAIAEFVLDGRCTLLALCHQEKFGQFEDLIQQTNQLLCARRIWRHSLLGSQACSEAGGEFDSSLQAMMGRLEVGAFKAERMPERHP